MKIYRILAYDFDARAKVFEVEVECDGWVNHTGNARTSFIENITDHAALYGQVL